MKNRVECPHCATSYTLDRLGLAGANDARPITANVACPICKKTFALSVKPTVEQHIVSEPGWFARNVMRRKPVTEEVSEREITTRAE